MKSIGLKLWAGMMFLVLFMILLLWLFQIIFLEKFYIHQQINQLDQKSQEVLLSLDFKDGVATIAEDEALFEQLDAFAYTYHLNLEIVNESGEVVFQIKSNNDQQSPSMLKKTTAGVIRQVLLGEKVVTTMEHPRFGLTYVLIGLPVQVDNNGGNSVVGALLINAPMAPVSDTADIIKDQLIYISLILFFGASVIAYLITKHLTRPILNIHRAAENIAKGQWDVDIQTTSKDEIGQLAKTIQEMAGNLKQTDLLRKELIGNISHELRTPLSLIRGYAETIQDVSGDQKDKRNQQLGIIIDESERLARLIDDIMNLSQLEVGVVKLNLMKLNLNEVLKSVVDRFENLAKKKQIVLFVNLQESLGCVGDLGRIEQVLFNLLGNAFNHTPEGGKIELKATAGQFGIRIEAIDSGAGIPEEELGFIWDRYYKADKTSGKNNTGTGLGLAIVKNILLAHGSEFGVKSTLGKGTTFWFELKKSE